MIMKIDKGLMKHVLLADENTELGKAFIANTDKGRQEALAQLMEKEERTPTETLLVAAIYSDSGMIEEAESEFQRCLKKRPDDAAAHLLYAMHALQFEGRREEAIGHFDKALKLETKNAAYPYYYGFCLWAVKSGGSAEEDALKTKELYERAIALNEDCASAHNELGLLLWDVLEEPEEAGRHFQRAIEIAPKDARGYGMYAVYLMEYKRDWKGAKMSFERALRLDPNDAQNHFDYGRLLAHGSNNNDRALAEMEKAVALEPRYSQAYFGIARIRLIAFQDTAAAREAIRAGLRLVNRDVPEDVLQALGDETLVEWAMAEADRYDGFPDVQKVLYEVAAQIAPEDETVCAELGKAHYLLDENDEARAVLERGVELHPDDARLNYLYGVVLENDFGDAEGSLRQYRKAVQLEPEAGSYHRALARVLRKTGGDADEIEEHLKESLELDPEELEAHRDYGVFLMEVKKEYDAAREELEEAESLEDYDNEDVPLHIHLAKAIMLTTGSKGKALEQFEEAMELNPDYHEGRREFANFLLDHYDSAREAKALYQEYLHKRPDSVQARIDYALLLKERLHDMRRARHHLEKALELDPENAECAKIMRGLDQETGPAKKSGKKVKQA